MTTFTATFSNGQRISRESDHAYAFAWAVMCGDKIVDRGFSADRANAAKAAENRMPRGPRASDRKNPATRRYWAKIAKDNGLPNTDALIKKLDDEAAARRSELRIEIVEVSA